jgi:hypothetical protein
MTAILLAAGWLVSAGLGHALPVSLTLEAPASTFYQQTENSPGIIGDPSMNNPAGFDHTLIGPNLSAWDLDSPVYTVGQIREIVGDCFMVGIDVNIAQNTHVLRYLSLTINDQEEFLYQGPSDLASPNNGNGYSDNLVMGFDLSGFEDDDLAYFSAAIGDTDDGREQLFLIACPEPPPVVPEPATLALAGIGLSLGGLLRLRRRNVTL